MAVMTAPTDRFVIGGETFEVTPATPLSASTLQAAVQRLGWDLPEDYAQFLTTHGTANVFGAQLLGAGEWRARCEPLDDDPAGMMASFLPFAEKTIPSGGVMLFCFRFEMSLRDMALKAAEREQRGAFHGAPYAVVACHLPTGLAGARLESAHRVIAPTFSAWMEQIIVMLRARAASA